MPARSFAQLFILIIALAVSWPAIAAEPTPPPVVIVVDLQKILEQSLAAKSVQQQLDSRRVSFQADTEKEENDLRNAEQALVKSHDKLSAPAYADSEQQLRQRFLHEESQVEARRKMLDQGFTDSMDAVRASLMAIVQAVAKEHGANLVLMRQQALWVDPSLDVTDIVLGRLNKALPQVTVKISAPPQAATGASQSQLLSPTLSLPLPQAAPQAVPLSLPPKSR